MRRYEISCRILGIALVLFTLAPAARAAVSEKDVLVIGRVVALLSDAPKGTVPITIVQGGDATRADTSDITAIIGSGKTIGAITFVANPMRYDQIENSPARILYIPDGMTPAELDRVFAVAVVHRLVTISTSDACLVAQRCAISVSSEPAVDIRLSVAASAATNVAFGSNFRMIVKEVR